MVAVVVGVVAAVVGPLLSPDGDASAADEIEWFVATPGYVRTDLFIETAVPGPDDNLVYVYAGREFDRRIVLVDIDDITIVAESPTTPRGMFDITMSGDGEWVYGVTENDLYRYDARTLELVNRESPMDAIEKIFDVADDGNRIALAMGGLSIVDDDIVEYFNTTPLLDIEALAFSGDDEVIAVTRNSVTRVDISDGFDVVTTLSDQEDFSSVNTVEMDGDSILLWSARSLYTLDADTLEVESQQDFGSGNSDRHRPVVHRLQDGIAVTGSQLFGNGQLARFEIGVDDPVGTRWTLPVGEQNVTPKAALPGGFVIAWEQGKMVLLNVDLLTSGFGDYQAVVPERVVDTRSGLGVPRPGRLAPGETIVVDIAGRAGLPEGGVLAVTMNVTATEPLGAGFIKIWPSERARPEISNLNYTVGRTVANGVTVTLGRDGKLRLYNHVESATHVLLDITGYYTTGASEPSARYAPITTPARVLDTRNATQGVFGKLGPGEFIDIEVPYSPSASIGEVDGAVAAVLNMTVVNATEFSFLSVYPSDAPQRPDVSTINFYPGDIRSNLTIAQSIGNTPIRLYNHAGTVDVVVDVLGHYIEPVADEPISQAGRYYPVTPFRRFDSRESSPFDGTGAIPPGFVLILDNSEGWTDIWNVTVTEPTTAGFVSAIPWSDQDGIDGSGTSTVNFVQGETVANGAYATGGPDNAVLNASGDSHVVVDVFGYLTPVELRSLDDSFNR